MNAIARESVITKLGTLMLANSEFAAEIQVLRTEILKRDSTIADLKAQLVAAIEAARSPVLPMEDLPANPYANGVDRDAKKVH